MLRDADRMLLFAVLSLLCIGLVIVYSASSIFAFERYGDSLFFLKRQLRAVAVGAVIFVVVAHVPYALLRRFSPVLLGIAALLLVAVLIPGVGATRGGATRWLAFGGFQFQPSEFARMAMVLFLAHILARMGDRIRDFWHGLMPLLALVGLFVLLILVEPDFGMSTLLLVVAGVMLFAAGARWLHVVPLGLAGALAGAVILMQAGYRQKRVLAFLDPWAVRDEGGFQVVQSWLAFRSGGPFGRGLGNGIQKLFYLPEAHTDFVFSVLAEEMGFLGVLLVIGLFALLTVRALRIAEQAPDPHGRLLALGLGLGLGLSAVWNLYVVLGLMPTKGLPLPFLSYGGTSMMAALFSVGVLANVSAAGVRTRNRRSEDAGLPKVRRSQRPSFAGGRNVA